MGDKKWVIFIDSMGPDDLEHMPFTKSLQTGQLDCFVPYVTPTVLGSIYTGKNPAQHGLPSVSKYEQDPRTRPNGLTIPEIAALSEDYDNVIQNGLPFIHPTTLTDHPTYRHYSSAMGDSGVYPADAANAMVTPAPAGQMDLVKDAYGEGELDKIFDLASDITDATFGVSRNLIEMWDSDLMFVSWRLADSWCHYHHDVRGDDGLNYREKLLRVADDHIKYCHQQGDVFVFGDHGATDLDSVFRINRWLIENGYLQVEIDWDWRDKSIEYGVIQEDEQLEEKGGLQLTGSDAGATVDEENSVAVGADPFSTGITLLDGATEESVEDLISDLKSESEIEDVFWTREKWQGDLIDECPDLYAHRREGVFVSGNLTPDPGGVEVSRTGVHHPRGAWASSVDVSSDDVDPMGLFGKIAHEYLGLDTDIESDDSEHRAERRDVMGHLEDMGYI